METKFTIEESSLICIFVEDGAISLENRNNVIKDIERALPFLDDTDMEELSHRVIRKLRNMTENEFNQLKLVVES